MRISSYILILTDDRQRNNSFNNIKIIWKHFLSLSHNSTNQTYGVAVIQKIDDAIFCLCRTLVQIKSCRCCSKIRIDDLPRIDLCNIPHHSNHTILVVSINPLISLSVKLK